MKIGVPKEVKNSESRVGLTEASVRQLVQEGHELYVETNAGVGCQITDSMYQEAGARIVYSASELWAQVDMIVKVKEPLPEEFAHLRPGLILYTYLHLAAEPELTRVLCERQVKAVAYETIQVADGSLPLLTPMSEVAGRMATQIGAAYLQKDHGGKGVLLGGVTGVPRARVVILGGGVVGTSAATMALGLGADVTVLDVNRNRLEYLDHVMDGCFHTLYSNVQNIEQAVLGADLLIGAVLLPGAKAPQLVSEKMIRQMQPGSVVVDVAVDQGGCIATCRPTSHQKPTFEVNGVIHYCVPNMPGVVPRTSTYALNNATFKYASLIAKLGLEKALHQDAALKKGLNVYGGYVCYEPVAKDLGLEYRAYPN